MAALDSLLSNMITQNKTRYHYAVGHMSTQLYSTGQNTETYNLKTIMMNTTDWIGSAAATFTTTAFIPQVWKVWRTRHTADISLGMYALFTLGVALWLTYGILLASLPIIIANSTTLLLAGAVLVMKLMFG
jgi:MtN3 and saliva related transmembrane protein